MPGSIAVVAAASKVLRPSNRAIKNSAIAVIPKRTYGNANSGSSETVRLQRPHRLGIGVRGWCRQTPRPATYGCKSHALSEAGGPRIAGSALADNDLGRKPRWSIA